MGCELRARVVGKCLIVVLTCRTLYIITRTRIHTHTHAHTRTHTQTATKRKLAPVAQPLTRSVGWMSRYTVPEVGTSGNGRKNLQNLLCANSITAITAINTETITKHTMATTSLRNT